MKTCPFCAEDIKKEAVKCKHCQTMLDGSNLQFQEKDKVTTGILAIFLGGLGIHHFYLGNNSRGFLYLLFCWTFIPAFISLIEGLHILLASNEVFKKNYLSIKNKPFIGRQEKRFLKSIVRIISGVAIAMLTLYIIFNVVIYLGVLFI